MTIELRMLVYSIVLGLVQIIIAVVAVTRQRGSKWNLGPRDEVLPPPSGVAGRLQRASDNFKETFPLFAAAILTAELVNSYNGLTLWGAQLYFWGRVVYLPLYAFGVPVARSAAWTVAALGIVLVLLGLW
jgi:uncharacterized MAPEG superfamily protein